MKTHKKQLMATFPIAFGALAGSLAIPLAAQTALEEVVVTAQKREQNVQEIPVAISVLGVDAIQRLDIKTMDDVVRVSPALTVSGEDDANSNVIRMRGIGTAVYSMAAEDSVAVVVDEVPLIQSAQAFGNLLDIERIEALRGPQGTLFGKNASAGVINITTQAPAPEFESRIGARFTSDDEKKIDVSLSGPLSDAFGYRLSGYKIDRDGYIKNLENGKDLNGEESWGLRGKLLWQPSDKVDVTLILDTSHKEASSMATQVEAGAVAIEGIKPGKDNRRVRLDTDHGYEIDQDMAVFKLNYEMPGHVLTSITSYQQYDIEQMIDGDRSLNKVPQDPFLNPGGFAVGTPEYESYQFRKGEALTQELRLTSTASNDFEYLIGLYYSDVENYQILDRIGIRFILDKWDAESSTENTAVFGQGSLALSESTYLDMGLRINREKIAADFRSFVDAPRFIGGPTLYAEGRDSETAVTGKFALRHFLPNDAMVYAAISTGYKGQAYDITSGTASFADDPAGTIQPAGSETSINYEVGLKGTTSDGRFRYEAVAFLTNFDDYQAQGAYFDGTAINFVLNNVGKLRTKGLELDFSYQATESLRLSLAGAYVDAVIRKFENAECYFGQTVAQGCVGGVQDLSGKDLNNSPKFKFNLGAHWEQAAGSLPFNWFATANYQWQDDVNFDLYGQPTNSQEAYGIANLGVGITESSGRYQVTLFVNNVFDQHYVRGILDQRQNEAGVSQSWARDSRRYGGIKASYSF